jgi:hypothetical protein
MDNTGPPRHSSELDDKTCRTTSTRLCSATLDAMPPAHGLRKCGKIRLATIAMTGDIYGHLFPRGEDGAELAAAERAFLGG